MKRHNRTYNPKAKIHISTLSSSEEQSLDLASQSQQHARGRPGRSMSPITSDITISASRTSLTESINRFRTDFEELKCKMRIFGESLDLCKCIASDFKVRVGAMDKRLENLEKRQRVERSESNYSAIIQKNKLLSNKTLQDAKDPHIAFHTCADTKSIRLAAFMRDIISLELKLHFLITFV